MTELFEGWFTLISGSLILLMGYQLFITGPKVPLNRYFFLATILLFLQNLFFFEIDRSDKLEEVLILRPLQESIWNAALMAIALVMYHYRQRFTNLPVQKWEVRLLGVIIALAPVFIFLEAFTSHGHGQVVLMDNGNWGLAFPTFTLVDWARATWTIVCYSIACYFSFIPYRYIEQKNLKVLSLFIFIFFIIIMSTTFTQNYIFTTIFQKPCAINETVNVVGGVLLNGLLLSNFRLFELRSEYAMPNILGTMTNWFILTDGDFKVKQVNEITSKTLGFAPKDWQFRHITNVIPKESWRTIKQKVLSLSEQESYNHEVNLNLPSRNIHILFTISPVQSARGKTKGFVFVGTDLTYLKESEQKIRNSMQELEVSNQALESFAYIASHDLKEPVRNIGSFAGLLKKKIGNGLSKEDGMEYIQYIIDSAIRMNKLINATMSISKIGRQFIRKEAVDINEVMIHVRNDLATFLKTHKAVVEWQNLPIVYGDRSMLRQLFQNLIENGIKYNKDERPKVLVNWMMGTDPDFYEISFTDNGIGIKKEYQKQIFEMFKRLHNHNNYEGTGVGLAICKRIVKLHNGDIQIDSQKTGTGSTFKVTLPKLPA